MGHGRSWRPVVLFAPARRAEIQLSGATAKIENTGTNPEENDIQIYGICMGEENPDLLAVAFEGVRNGHEMDGVAVFRDNGDLFGYTLLSIREDASGAPLLYETRYRQEFETPFTLIAVHRDEIARVRASWNGVELSRLGGGGGGGGPFEWGGFFPENPRTAAPMSASTTPTGTRFRVIRQKSPAVFAVFHKSGGDFTRVNKTHKHLTWILQSPGRRFYEAAV